MLSPSPRSWNLRPKCQQRFQTLPRCMERGSLCSDCTLSPSKHTPILRPLWRWTVVCGHGWGTLHSSALRVVCPPAPLSKHPFIKTGRQGKGQKAGRERQSLKTRKAMFSLKMLPLLLLLHVQLSRAFPVSFASLEEKNRNIVQVPQLSFRWVVDLLVMRKFWGYLLFLVETA